MEREYSAESVLALLANRFLEEEPTIGRAKFRMTTNVEEGRVVSYTLHVDPVVRRIK